MKRCEAYLPFRADLLNFVLERLLPGMSLLACHLLLNAHGYVSAEGAREARTKNEGNR
jgi:hypothetical protein